jgi:hypothetical protein
MNMTVATAAALGAATLFATSAAVQASALRPPAGSIQIRPADGWRPLVRACLTPTWLFGAALAALAFALHAMALHEGDLTLVQPLLVSVVLFALPADRVAGGPVVTHRELGWALLLVAGLAAFFAIAHPVAPTSLTVDHWQAGAAAGLAALAAAICALLAERATGGVSAALFGASAGIAFAGVAALVKSATNALTNGPGSFITSWQLYALVAAGAAGIILSQLAYRSGPLSAGIPAMNSVNPLVSVILGVTVFDEHIRTGVWPYIGEVAALGAVTAATIFLSRRQALGHNALRT